MSSKSFGNRILILVSLLLVLPVLLSIYMMHIIKNSELSLLEHQKARLNQAAYLFDQSISGSLDDYLAARGASGKNRKERINILGPLINEAIENVKKEYPEMHIGLWHKELDVFFDGTTRFDENFSLRRKKAFDETLSNQKEIVNSLGPEEGGIVEIYKPFTRGGKVEGVIRSAEYLSETGFYGKRKRIEGTVYVFMAAVIVLGIGGAMIFFRQLVYQVQFIKDGVKKLESDLTATIPRADGELGDIVEAINGFAHKIADLNLYNEVMLATIDDAILVVDVEGRVVIANNMARTIFKLPENCTGLPYEELFPPGAPFTALLGRTLRENLNLKDLQVNWVNNHHGKLDLRLSISILLDRADRTIGAVLFCRDITERLRLEERLHRQERLASLGKLVAGVAHEIRNPLTAISFYIQHWQNQNKPNPRALATMYREVARLDAIIDQLLYFAKPAQAKFEKYDINIMIENILAFFGEIHQGRFNLVKDLSPLLPEVLVDPEQIERVLVNILFNAIQAIPEGGTIIICTKSLPEEGQVKVSISDNGCGIPREHLPHLFDPFYSTRPKGTGLGLAIAHEIVQAHGGHIEVESEVGQGTEFSFYLKTGEGS